MHLSFAAEVKSTGTTLSAMMKNLATSGFTITFILERIYCLI
jgi:hypothetical protein